VVNALPSQITLITTTSNGPQQTLTVMPQQVEKSIPAKVTVKASGSSNSHKVNGLQW